MADTIIKMDEKKFKEIAREMVKLEKDNKLNNDFLYDKLNELYGDSDEN